MPLAIFSATISLSISASRSPLDRTTTLAGNKGVILSMTSSIICEFYSLATVTGAISRPLVAPNATGDRFDARSATGRSCDGPDAREAGEHGSEAGVDAWILTYAAVMRGLISLPLSL